jgi:hypothetical protein
MTDETHDTTLTVAAVRDTVAEISRIRHDDEVAHVIEDRLWERALRAIAAGAPNPAELAAEALKSADLEFNRHCA